MATSGGAGNVNKKVNLDLSINSTGVEAIADLSIKVKALAKDGGEAAPQFERFANELDKIAAQQDAVNTLDKLGAAVRDATDSYEKATIAANKLGVELNEQKQITTATLATQDKEKATLIAVRETRAALTDAIKANNIALKEGSISEQDHLTTDIQLQKQLLETNKTLRDQRAAVVEANKAVRDQVAAQKELQGTFDAANKTANQYNTSLDARATAFRSAGDAAEKLGVDTSNLAAEDARLKAAFDQTQGSAVELASFMRELAVQQATLADQQARARAELLETVAGYDQFEKQLRATEAAQLELLKTENNVRESEAALRAIYADVLASQKDETVSIRQNETAKRELAEADRLLRIEQEAMNALLRNGADALAAEQAAIREAAQAANIFAAEQKRIADAAQASEAEIKQLAQAAREAQAAFQTVTGFRSAAAIEADIAQINVGLKELAANANVTQAEFGRAFVGAQGKIAGLRSELAGLPEATNRAGSGMEYLKGQFAQLAAIYSGFEIARKFIEANVEIQTLTRTLTNVTGSSAEAAKSIDLLRDTANRNGIAVQGMADDFVKFQASARTAGLSAAQVNTAFVNITNAAGALGLSTERVGLILNGLGQIAGKGTVQMEELKGQIGDSLPGALKIAADALGLTTNELAKMTETGSLTAQTFIPLFVDQIPKAFGSTGQQAEGLQQSFNRLSNAFRAFFQQASDSKALNAISAGMDYLAKNVSGVVDALATLGLAFAGLKIAGLVNEVFGISTALVAAEGAMARTTLATTANTTATALNTGAQTANAGAMTEGIVAKTAATAATARLTVATEANAVATAASLTSFGRVATTVGTVSSGLIGLGARLLSSTNLLSLAAVAAYTYGDNLGQLAGKIITGIDLAKNEATIKDQLVAKTQQLTEAERQRLLAQVNSTAQFAKAAASLQVATAVAEKHEQAVKNQGAALEKLAQITGNEVNIRLTALDATNKSITAAQATVAARQAEAAALVALVASQEKASGGYKNMTKDQQDSIDKSNDKIKKLAEEATAESAQLESLKAEQVARQLAVDTYGNQSAKLGELTTKFKDATETIKALNQMQKEGVDTTVALRTAQVDLATAEAKVRDAIEDSTKQLALNIKTIQTRTQLTNLDKQVEIDRLKVAEARATSDGNEYEAGLRKIDQQKVAISQTETSIAGRQAELVAQRNNIQAEEDALKSIDGLTDAKKAELAARKAAIEVGLKEIEISKQHNELSKIELQDLEKKIGLYNASVGSLGQMTDAMNVFGAAAIKARNAADLSVLGKTGSLGKNSDGSDFSQTGQLNIPEGGSFDQAAFNRDRAANPGATLDMQRYVKGPPALAATGPYSGSKGFSQNPDGTYTGANKGVQAPAGGSTNTAQVGQASPSAVPKGAATTQIALNVNVGTTSTSFTGAQTQADKLLSAIKQAQRSGGY
jgi:tape measure domain-containing protein